MNANEQDTLTITKKKYTMKKHNLTKQLSIIFIGIFSLTLIAGCNINKITVPEESTNINSVNVDASSDKSEPKNNQVASAPYFKKGVYLNYSAVEKNPSKNYFYVFYDEVSGHTDDGSVGMGLPFACEQKKGVIKFSFGGVGPEGEDFLTIESAENGNVTGYFNDGKKLIFTPVPNVNPDDFDAEKYLNTKN